MYGQMLAAARDRLVGRELEEVVRRSGAEVDGARTMLRMESLGREIQVSWPELAVEGAWGEWHQLVILHYLDIADGTLPCGRLISFAALKDGMVRGGGFDRQSASDLGRILKDRGEGEICAALKALGGRSMVSNADVCVEIPFLPRYPVTVKVWLADEEMELSARMLLDACADHYLSVEDAVTAGSIVLDALEAQFE